MASDLPLRVVFRFYSYALEWFRPQRQEFLPRACKPARLYPAMPAATGDWISGRFGKKTTTKSRPSRGFSETFEAAL